MSDTGAGGKPKARRRGVIAGLSVVLFCGVFYFVFGFFVVQPIGAVPDGATIFYVRAGLDIDFIESADGLAEDATGGVSLLGRMGGLAAFTREVGEDRKLLRLPYMRWMYLVSTGGKEYER